MDSLSVKRRLTCILAADAVGYSSHVGHDEDGTIRILAAHRAVIDGIIAFHEGRIIGTAGDSVLAEFASVVKAVRCAVEIQETLKTRNDSLPEGRQMYFRVGVNLGDVVVKDQDLLGDDVNVAARLETIAEPGGICISSSVYDQITGKHDLGFQDIGEQSLKNIARPIRVYRLTEPAPAALLAASSAATSALKASASRSPSWAMGALGVAPLAAVVAWQAGWLRSGSSDSGASTRAVTPTTAPQSAPGPDKGAPPAAETTVGALRAQADADPQRLRSEPEALRRQAETELARTRAEGDAARSARTKADAEAAAARLRMQAEADAAQIRADAQAKAAETQREADARAKAVATPPRPPTPSQDNSTRVAAVAHNSAFDGAWNMTVACPVAADGALD